MTGYVQVYTGNGKGKTTAALGLALRAAGSGMKVFIGQFVKGMKYSELNILPQLKKWITVVQFGRGCFIYDKPKDEDIQVAQKGFVEIRKAVLSGEYDLVILDEANIATYFNLISVDDFLKLITDKPSHVELVFTGRYAHEKLIEAADLVTEMKEIKHYYTHGVDAREGIEK